METLIEALFTGSLVNRLPAWAITTGFLFVVLKYTGLADKWAKGLNGMFEYLRKRDQLEAEQERWEAERESEIEQVQVNATVQAQAAQQLADQRAQQQLHKLLEQSLMFLQNDLSEKVNLLTTTVTGLQSEIGDMRSLAAQARESMRISHTRIDVLAGIVPKIAENFDSLKPHLTQLTKSHSEMRPAMQNLEAAIRMLVEQLETNEPPRHK